MADEAELQAQARVGCVLDDKWTLERLLGMGGMAAVYAARHRNGARAAVKVLHFELSRHKDVRERFRREGYAANRVEHAGAVKVLDDDVVVAGPEAGTAYLVMELLEGQSLQDRLERGPPVGELEFLAITRSVLEVLEAAHAHGVVHRDLKPENLFLARGGVSGASSSGDRVKVLDFGLARLIQGQAITTYGLALGTPSFMSPEQAAGRIDEIDGRTDLFALGATGFRICTGRRIHEATNPIELVRKMANLPAPRVRTLRPEVSQPCARVIDRALEFRREDRYETAAAMREDVERAAAELEARGPTQLAVPPPLSVPARSHERGPEPTIEVSGRDLESDRPPLPLAPTDLAVEESIRIPKRRSALGPVMGVGLLVAAALGAKFWLAHRLTKVGVSVADSTAASALPVSSDASAAPTSTARAYALAGDLDGGAEGSAGQTDSAVVAVTHPDASSPDAHQASPKAAPGNVHKVPRKHRPTRPLKGGVPAKPRAKFAP